MWRHGAFASFRRDRVLCPAPRPLRRAASWRHIPCCSQPGCRSVGVRCRGLGVAACRPWPSDVRRRGMVYPPCPITTVRQIVERVSGSRHTGPRSGPRLQPEKPDHPGRLSGFQGLGSVSGRVTPWVIDVAGTGVGCWRWSGSEAPSLQGLVTACIRPPSCHLTTRPCAT